MTDEERAEIEHFIELHEAGLLMEAKGLGSFASRIEDAVKKGAYKKYDAGVLHELISVAVRALERAKFFLTPEVEEPEADETEEPTETEAEE